MDDITIQGLDADTLERLQRRAVANQRALEEEIRHILTWAVENIERIQTLTAGMTPMEMPKPSTDETPDEDQRRRSALRERLRQREDEEKRMTQEMLEELDDVQRGLTKVLGDRPTRSVAESQEEQTNRDEDTAEIRNKPIPEQP